MKIGLQLHPEIDQSQQHLKEILEFLIAKGNQLYLSEDITTPGIPQFDNLYYVSKRECVREIDVMLSIGGDGTFLGGLRLIRGTDIPILGIHLGGLGFLADLSIDDYHHKFEALFKGDYSIEERYSLVAQVRPIIDKKQYMATNEFHIDKGNVANMIKIRTFVDDEYLNTYRADGLLISSPTGSTAYGLSAGGPIISPDLDVMAISPICPHSLSARPVIISGEEEVRIDTRQYQDESLVIDGSKRINLANIDDVIIRRSQDTFKLIRFKEESFFKTLRKKLNWGLDNRGNE